MKAITLHQPWASLIAVGAKTIETRSWAPPKNLIGERIAIHAGKRLVSESFAPEVWQPIWDSRGKEIEVPLGAVVCTAVLECAMQVQSIRCGVAFCDALPSYTPRKLESEMCIDIDPYGDFDVGRWLWILEDVQPLVEAIFARGYQGFWDWHSN